MSQSSEDRSAKIDKLMQVDQGARRLVTAPRATPHSDWVCGYAELGKCCALGPNSDGRCGRLLRVQPASKNEVSSADPIDDALPPCIPRRSHAWRRQSLRINLAILTAGLLLLCMMLPSREQSFVPGDLSAGHAQIMATTLVSQRCGLCHPNSHGDNSSPGSANFLTDVLNATAKRLVANDGRQDALCMQCHKSHMSHAAERNPHDLSVEQWRELIGQRQTQPPGQLVSSRAAGDEVRLPKSVEGKTSCASCHNEHHGRGFDISLIADDRCQACHQRRFESLASGHPEFVNFPGNRPRALAFSHQAHAEKHFGKKNRTFDCRACHLDLERSTTLGPVTRSVSFELACASCHNEPIRAATIDGWAVMQLPSIDARSATTHANLKHWPAAARFGFEGTVSPVMRALLEGDDTVRESLKQIPTSGNLAEVPTIDGQRERITMAIAIATERLIHDTASSGQAAWQSRLTRVTESRLGRSVNDRDRAVIAAMCRGVSPDLFRRLEQQWFQETATLAEKQSPASMNNQLGNNQLGDRLGQNSAPPGRLVQRTIDASTEPDSLVPSATNNDALLTGTDLLNDEELLAGGADLLASPSSASAKQRPIVKGATHLSAGGWYLDEQTLTLRYMPVGHADETLAAWCLWWETVEYATAPATNSSDLAHTSPALDQPGRPLASFIPGGCVECHAIRSAIASHGGAGTSPLHSPSSDSDAPIEALWKVPQRSATQKEFTKFNHTPHLQLPSVSDCRYCHQIQSTAVSSYATYHHSSEFASMNLSHCTACHRPGGASDRCTNCHNYHVDR